MGGNSDNCIRGLEHMANLGIEFGVEEVVVWIFLAERVTRQQCLRSWTFGRIPAFSVSTKKQAERDVWADLHSETVIHKRQRCRTDSHGNVVWYRRCLTQASKLENGTDRLFFAPWPATSEHL